MNINEIINYVISGVNKDWSTLEKVRYAYLELGKYLQKNTDFFFSVDNKLGDNNLTFDEIQSIYNDDLVVSGEIICKSASSLLKMILDRLGIESKLVMSVNNVINYRDDDNSIDINHWFLVVNDGVGEIFCTLSSDLPYIQMGYETRHFGVNIPYEKVLSDGTVNRVYEGEEIHHRVISSEELKEVDKKIGYINTYYKYNDSSQSSKDWHLQYNNASLAMLRDGIRGNKLFHELEVDKSGFYDRIFNFRGVNGDISFYDTKLDSLTDEDMVIWTKKLCQEVLNLICRIIGYDIYPIPTLESSSWNYDAWLFSLCVMLQDEIFMQVCTEYDDFWLDEIDVTNFQYNKWSKKVKKDFDVKGFYEQMNLLIILDKLNAIVSLVRNNGNVVNLGKLLSSLSYHFMDVRNLYENNIEEDGRLSNYYIANKFQEVFSRVFSCNDLVTDFNKMSYSEQVVIIKEVLGIIFPEVTSENSRMVKDYDESYSPILNRIQIFPIKSKHDRSYSIIFSIFDDKYKEDDYYFFYNLQTNEFDVCDLFDIYSDYIIVSNRMKDRYGIEQLENIEEKSRI